MFQLRNDVSKKREFWQLFSKKNNCELQYFRTKSHDASRLLMEYNYKTVNVSFNESDGKPFLCHFTIKDNSKLKFEICEKTFLNKLFDKPENSHPFLSQNMIKSNNPAFRKYLMEDTVLLNLLDKSEFTSLYAYSKQKVLNVRISGTFFIDNITKLNGMYILTNKIIDKILFVLN